VSGFVKGGHSGCGLWPTLAVLMAFLTGGSLMAAEVPQPFPGERTRWQGYDRYDFEVAGRGAIVVAPKVAAPGRPWIWWAEFFGHRPEPEIALLGMGYHVVHLKTQDLFGSPKAMTAWEPFYKQLVEQHGLAKKAAYVGISRGGLYCYNWASLHPDRVACIYADGPVCDINTWPLAKGRGPGSPGEIPRLLAAYDVADEAALQKVVLNPIDRLQPIAAAKIPLIHVYGDADTPVPWDQNTIVLADRYKALGGEITLIAKPGVGHVHGLDDSTPLVDFIDRHCRAQFAVGVTGADPSAPVAIGNRRELFVDRFLIDRLDACRLVLHEPRDMGPVHRLDRKWEGLFSGYSTILRDGDRYLMYYRGLPKSGRDGSEDERTCLAESTDGIHWTRPDVGIYEFEGSTKNNIVLAKAAPATHNLSPFIDTRPGVPAGERFKAIGGNVDKLWGFVSADGRRWTRIGDGPLITKADVPIPHEHLFDSQNVCHWSVAENCYVCYFRVWDGLRRIARTTSTDFRKWTPAVLMQQVHDDGSGLVAAPTEHLYTNQTFPYFRAPHLSISTAARFFPDRQVLTDAEARALGVDPGYFKDTSDAVFLTTRGGDRYDRTFLSALIKPGIGAANWVSRTNYPALNVVQTGPTEMSLYVNQDYAQPTAHIQRYAFRLDGFASIQAGAETGLVITRPFTFTGKTLRINFSTSAAGGLRFELTRPDGSPIPGFTLAESREQIGNEIERTVTWKNGGDVSTLAGQPVRLRVELRDADLFAIQFTE
jgi:pimeloyl-ACP methyl ester carboxylesterase